jgi:hypothetical protein
VALNTVAICTAIAGLTVSGVRMLNLDAIPEVADPRDVPAMWPRPDGFIEDVNVQVDSFGSSQAKKTVTYTLVYVYAHSPLGAGRGLFDTYPDTVVKACAILDAIIANDAIQGAAIDITPSAGAFGPVGDPSGNAFHGCEIRVAVTEFVN